MGMDGGGALVTRIRVVVVVVVGGDTFRDPRLRHDTAKTLVFTTSLALRTAGLGEIQCWLHGPCALNWVGVRSDFGGGGELETQPWSLCIGDAAHTSGAPRTNVPGAAGEHAAPRVPLCPSPPMASAVQGGIHGKWKITTGPDSAPGFVYTGFRHLH